MRFLFRVDDWLADSVEGFSHWTQRCFGITSSHWERLFLVLAACGYICLWIPLNPAWYMWPEHFALIACCFPGFLKASKKELPTGDSVTINPKRHSQRTYRLIALVVAFIGLVLTKYLYIWFVFFTAAYYFEAVTDLPQQPSKARQWIESLQASGSLVPVETTR